MKQKVRKLLAISGMAAIMGSGSLVLGASAASCSDQSRDHNSGYTTDQHENCTNCDREDCDKKDCDHKDCNKDKDTRKTHDEKYNHSKNWEKNYRLAKKQVTVVGEVKSSIGYNTFKLKRGYKEYTVRMDSHTKFLDHRWKKTSSTNFKEGDRVRVYGKLTSRNTITAKSIFNLSR